MHLTLTHNAELVREGRQTFLKVRNDHFGWDEIIPAAVYGPSTVSAERQDITAGEFVIECMTKLHHAGEPWPALAVAFLYDLELSERKPETGTLLLTKEAELVMDADGRCHLAFRGASYSRDDIVPPEIFPGNFPYVQPGRPYMLPKSAGDFVTSCMAQVYGLGHEWPDMAQEFLWPKRP